MVLGTDYVKVKLPQNLNHLIFVLETWVFDGFPEKKSFEETRKGSLGWLHIWFYYTPAADGFPCFEALVTAGVTTHLDNYSIGGRSSLMPNPKAEPQSDRTLAARLVYFRGLFLQQCAAAPAHVFKLDGSVNLS